jgi:hypothetical protein
MQKKTLTEGDVYKANSKFIREVCQHYGKNLEREEREAIANLGMLNAIRSYRRGASEFWSYAISCIRDILVEEEYIQRKARRIEYPLSLDMRIKSGESSATYIEMFAHPNSDCISLLITSDFIKHLDKNLQYLACLCIENYSIAEIAERMNIPIVEVERLKTVLCYKWKEYDK